MFHRLACSFCRRSSAEVAKLVAGPRVYICDRCVAIASRIMDGDAGPATPPDRRPTFRERVQRCLGAAGRFRRRGGLERAAAGA
jgi:hypothetical protein